MCYTPPSRFLIEEREVEVKPAKRQPAPKPKAKRETAAQRHERINAILDESFARQELERSREAAPAPAPVTEKAERSPTKKKLVKTR